MRPRRIILANQPRLLREMLKRVLEKVPDLQVVAEIAYLPKTLALVDRTRAEWIILSPAPNGQMPEVVETILARYPTTSILSLATDGSQVTLKWIEARERKYDDLSLKELIAVLRSGTPIDLRDIRNGSNGA